MCHSFCTRPYVICNGQQHICLLYSFGFCFSLCLCLFFLLQAIYVCLQNVSICLQQHSLTVSDYITRDNNASIAITQQQFGVFSPTGMTHSTNYCQIWHESLLCCAIFHDDRAIFGNFRAQNTRYQILKTYSPLSGNPLFNIQAFTGIMFYYGKHKCFKFDMIQC